MREDILEDQHELVELIEAAGWDVTETELSVYESPWAEDGDIPEATVVLTARKVYREHEGGDEDDDNPFRVK